MTTQLSSPTQQGEQFDYTHQAWVKNGKYIRCGHPDSMDCRCYGKLHEGEDYYDRSVEMNTAVKAIHAAIEVLGLECSVQVLQDHAQNLANKAEDSTTRKAWQVAVGLLRTCRIRLIES